MRYIVYSQNNKTAPSIKAVTKSSAVFEISLEYPASSTDLLLEKNVVNKIIELQKPYVENKAHVFAMLDAFLRDHKTKKAYAL